MKIWVLFSVDNEYNQPDCNLCCWWQDKPSVQILADCLGVGFDKEKGHEKLDRVANGEEVDIARVLYRLEQVEEGVSQE